MNAGQSGKLWKKLFDIEAREMALSFVENSED
jgi:hypothetical protein